MASMHALHTCTTPARVFSHPRLKQQQETSRPTVARAHIHDGEHKHDEAETHSLHNTQTGDAHVDTHERPQVATATSAKRKPAITFRGGIPTLSTPAERRKEQLATELAAVNARLALAQSSAHSSTPSRYAVHRQREAYGRVVRNVTARDAYATISEANGLSERVERTLDEHSADRQYVHGSERALQLQSLREEVRRARQRAEELEARTRANARRIAELEHGHFYGYAVHNAEESSNVSHPAFHSENLLQENGVQSNADAQTEDQSARDELHRSVVPTFVDAGHEARERVAHQRMQRKRRKGLRHRFADTRSLHLPDLSSPLANHWFPVAFLPHSLRTRSSKGSGRVVTHGVRFFGRDWTIWMEKDGALRCRASKRRFGEIELPEMRAERASDLVWVWPGTGEPKRWMLEQESRRMAAPDGFSVHAELELDVPVEHGLLIENLVDLAHAPFTHTSTFAKGWDVPSVVRFAFFSPNEEKTSNGQKRRNKGGPSKPDPGGGQFSGRWDPYPIDMRFEPPCLVQSLIGVDKPGASGGGASFRDGNGSRHVHQVHACLPSDEGKTKLLYRLSLDFAHWLQHIPLARDAWKRMAEAVLEEDRRLVVGQQDRMRRGGRVWANPVGYDAMALQYRRWRNAAQGLEFPREDTW